MARCKASNVLLVVAIAVPAADEDENAGLLLACGEDGRITFSIMYTGGFPYSLKSPVSVLLRVDIDPAVTTAAVMIGQAQISIDPRVSSRFRVLYNGKQLFDVEDSTFSDAGKVGLWTKADSVTVFDQIIYSETN